MGYTRAVDEDQKPSWPGPLGAGRQILDDAYLRADRAIDRGQFHAFRVLWFFLPETSIAKDARFQQLLASRFFSDAGQQALLYGALIAVVRGQAALVRLSFVFAGRAPVYEMGVLSTFWIESDEPVLAPDDGTASGGSVS